MMARLTSIPSKKLGYLEKLNFLLGKKSLTFMLTE